jgi:hypothetical protein
MIVIDISDTTAKLYIDSLVNLESYDSKVCLDGTFFKFSLAEDTKLISRKFFRDSYNSTLNSFQNGPNSNQNGSFVFQIFF